MAVLKMRVPRLEWSTPSIFSARFPKTVPDAAASTIAAATIAAVAATATAVAATAIAATAITATAITAASAVPSALL